MQKLYQSRKSFKRLLSITIRRRSRGGEKDFSVVNDGYASSPAEDPLVERNPQWKPSWRCFCYEEIHKATNGFHKENLVGRGGDAEVYRGVQDDGQVIAVKKMTRASNDEQKEKDFLTELGTIGHVT